MDDVGAAPPLWRATVPVFGAVLDRMSAELRRAEMVLGARFDAALAQRPGPQMLPVAKQVATAQQFTLRIAYPLAGLRIPELRGGLDGPGLQERGRAAKALLADLDPAAFAGAGTRIVTAQAGFAMLEMPGEAFLYGFGLPNLYFHQAMAHVALKQAGVALGKADFDGRHDYPEGFSLG